MMMKRRGARGHPCLIALWSWTLGVIRFGRLVFMASCVFFSELRVNCMKSLLAPMRIRPSSMLSHRMESYAFDMS